jgi:class 3 adenylate cyclase
MIKSLQAKFIILLILPVSLILISAGTVGFLYARDKLLVQWNEAAILKLEKVAHQVDMRLSRPLELLQILYNANDSKDSDISKNSILNRIESLDGVEKVIINYTEAGAQSINQSNKHMMDMSEMMHFHRAEFANISLPSYDTETGMNTVRLVSSLIDKANKPIGSLEIFLSFDYLIGDIRDLGWWQSDMACLINQDGNYILHTSDKMKGRLKLGETKNQIELSLIDQLKTKSYGTIKDDNHPPKQVAGFYSLDKAPWTIVLFAPGETVFKPIINARNSFILGSVLVLVLIIILIRFNVGKTVSAIKLLSLDSINVANGVYQDPINISSKDEIGQLVESYNKMVEGLRERDFIRNTFGRYIDPDFAKELVASPEKGKLGGHKKEVVIMMTDIRNFTSISETLDPESIIYILNHYFSHMIDVIQKRRGIIVDFVGDGILLFFEPINETLSECIQRSLQCANELQNEMGIFNAQMKESNLPEFEIGIGLNCGAVVVGNIGTETRAKYGIVGSEVNLTQRIQDQAKGGEIVISESISNNVDFALEYSKSFTKKLKGVRSAVTLHVLT